MNKTEFGRVGGKGPFGCVNTVEDFKVLTSRFPDIFEFDGEILWSLENYSQSGTTEIPRIYVFDSQKQCDKCGHLHKHVDPSKEYDPVYNLLGRACIRCGNKWLELCFDGTKPNLEVYHLMDGGSKNA